MSIKAFRFQLRTRPLVEERLRRITGMGRIAQGGDFVRYIDLPIASCKTHGVPQEVIENSIGRLTA